MIDWTVPPFSSTHLRAVFDSPWSFEETVARIAGASGQEVKSNDEYKCSVSFEGTFKGQRFTLYDYKEDREIHIGGSYALDVVALISELIRVLTAAAPVSYRAKEYYHERRTHSWGD